MSLEQGIRERLAPLASGAPEALELVDESGAHAGHAGAIPGVSTHWRLTLVSHTFEGRPAVARHRMVYALLSDLMNNPIHALQIRALTPAEAGRPHPLAAPTIIR